MRRDPFQPQQPDRAVPVHGEAPDWETPSFGPSSATGLTLRMVNLEIECEALGELVVRRFVTNTLRGGFGYQLKDLVCVAPLRDCSKCALRLVCMYTRSFHTELSQEDPHRMAPPPPYVFDFRDWGLATEAGGRFRFSFRVFGDATAYVPYYLAALFRLGESGLGGDHTRFRILEVKRRGPQTDEEPRFEIGGLIRQSDATWIQMSPVDSCHTATVIFRTPAIVKKEGKIHQQLSPRDLLHAIHRRISLLQRFYEPEAVLPALDEDLLEHIEVLHSDVTPISWSRRSTRTEETMTWSGLVGRIRVGGPLASCAPILRAAAWTHVGSKTAFGLGAVDVDLGCRDA